MQCGNTRPWVKSLTLPRVNGKPSISSRQTSHASLSALLVLPLGAHASDHRGALTEEFHQTYALTADGRIELDNINGDVHISSWDQNQVKVDAIKYADTKERLDEAKIEIDSRSDTLSVRTKYPDHNRHWDCKKHDQYATED